MRACTLNCLFGQGADHLGGESRDLVRLTGHRASHEPKGMRDAFGEIDAKLGKKPTDHQLARPVMARAAGLHPDETGRKLRKERHHLRPPERSPDDYLATAADGVHLED